MSINNTTLLGLAQPVTGQESGVWGDDVNNGLTILIDVSVAGTNNITQDSDITLSVSNGNNSSTFTSTATNSTVAQYSTLNCTGARGAIRNIIAPASSRTFVVINNTTGGFAIVIKKSGGTGVSIAPNETAIVYYDSVTATDYVKVSSTVNVSSFSAGTTGFTPSTATSGAVTLAGTLATTNGGTGLTSFTANGVVYASSTSALATGSALTWDGTIFSITGSGGLKLANDANLSWVSSNLSIGADTGLGEIFYSATGGSGNAHVFSVGGSEQMRLNSTGLGIGTSSPSYKLDVNGAGRIKGTAWVDRSSTSSNAIVNWSTNGTYDWQLYTTASATPSLSFYQGGVGDRMTLDTSGNLGLGVTPSAWTNFKAVELPNGVAIASYTSGVNAGWITQNAYYTSGVFKYKNSDYATGIDMESGQIRFQIAASGTSGNTISFSQAMTLDNSGNLLVGTTTPISSTNTFSKPTGYYSLSVNNTTSSTGGSCLYAYFSNASPNNTSDYFFNGTDQTTSRVQFRANGGLANYSANNVNLSDATMKKDITPSKNYLDVLNQIPVVTFLLNDQTDNELNLGVTAQSVQAVAPELVGTIDIGTKDKPNVKLAIYETDLKYAMLKAIQELNTLVTAQSAEIQSLKAEVATLKGA